MNNLTQAVHPRPDINMHMLLLSIRVEELRMICISIIAIVAGTGTTTIVIFIQHSILFSGQLQVTQSPKLVVVTTKWGFEIVKVQFGLVC